MKKQEIVSVLSELHKITGFRVSLHGADYAEIAAFPETKCRLCQLVHRFPEEYNKCVSCDKEACKKALESKDTHIYKCRYGLTEAVSPLYNFGTLTGFLMMGQVNVSSERSERARGELLRLTNDPEAVADAFDKIPVVKADMISSYVKIMTICAQYLTLSNAIPNEKPTVAQMARKFIFDNFSSKISIKDICTSIGCSKSTLVTAFKKEYGVTVNEFITEVRLSEAVKMIEMGEKSIGEIAISTGFADQSYFSKVFSQNYGMPPSLYVQSVLEAKED